MAQKNLTLDWWPVGTGPYMLTENNPNARMVLERNPNFHGERYPSEGEPEDAAAGLLADAGKALPFIEKVVFTREKEGIPYWNKFMQGYYDTSGIGSDQFDQAVRVSIEGDTNVTPEMEEKGIRLSTSVETTTGYIAFNGRASCATRSPSRSTSKSRSRSSPTAAEFRRRGRSPQASSATARAGKG
jgi:ABC-type transport system substrate-binding protein